MRLDLDKAVIFVFIGIIRCHVEIQAVCRTNLILNLPSDGWVFFQEHFRVFAALPDAFITVAEPSARFLDDARLLTAADCGGD